MSIIIKKMIKGAALAAASVSLAAVVSLTGYQPSSSVQPATAAAASGMDGTIISYNGVVQAAATATTAPTSGTDGTIISYN